MVEGGLWVGRPSSRRLPSDWTRLPSDHRTFESTRDLSPCAANCEVGRGGPEDGTARTMVKSEKSTEHQNGNQALMMSSQSPISGNSATRSLFLARVIGQLVRHIAWMVSSPNKTSDVLKAHNAHPYDGVEISECSGAPCGCNTLLFAWFSLSRQYKLPFIGQTLHAMFERIFGIGSPSGTQCAPYDGWKVGNVLERDVNPIPSFLLGYRSHKNITAVYRSDGQTPRAIFTRI
jgi:hypothetical protein